MVIGRSDDSGLHLNSRGVSRRHARVVPDVSGLILTDLGSTTGVLINGLRVKVACLAAGEQFSVGPYVVRVQVDLESKDGHGHLDPAQSQRSNGLSRGLANLEQFVELIDLTDQQAVLESLLERSMSALGELADDSDARVGLSCPGRLLFGPKCQTLAPRSNLSADWPGNPIRWAGFLHGAGPRISRVDMCKILII
jgi:predicted component of type VI protein secretion system